MNLFCRFHLVHNELSEGIPVFALFKTMGFESDQEIVVMINNRSGQKRRSIFAAVVKLQVSTKETDVNSADRNSELGSRGKNKGKR